MIVTEAEAKTKMCPYRNMPSMGERGPTILSSSCVASGCMKWNFLAGNSPREREVMRRHAGDNNELDGKLGYCKA